MGWGLNGMGEDMVMTGKVAVAIANQVWDVAKSETSF